MSEQVLNTEKDEKQEELQKFFGNGLFDWQISNKSYQEMWNERCYNEEKYWGGFSREPFDAASYTLPDWAIGPFTKYSSNPIFAPSLDGWDNGHFGGGVHNGSIIKKDGKFYYIYRGEQELAGEEFTEHRSRGFDYICDIGLASSEDGIHFTRDTEHSPFFRKNEDAKYSFEDVSLVKYEDTYYLSCNRWDWLNPVEPSICGAYLATSKDLLNWEKVGLVFPDAKVIHRNPVILQNPDNEAVKVNGKFIMYLNEGQIAYSDDLIHWESNRVAELWPGGEGCFALADYSDTHRNKILLFTGGHHTGHFYAIGEVLFSMDNPEKPIEWLPRPVLYVEDQYPWENGLSAEPPYKPVSYWRDTIFFTGLTRNNNQWMAYYGGSEYYTCLATARV